MTKKGRVAIAIGLVTFTLFILFFLNPSITETVYHKGIFKVLRIGYDYTLGFLPFPTFYLFIVGVLYFFYRFISGITKLFKSYTFQKLKAFTLSFGLFLVCLVAVFYMSWGFNYARPTFQEQLGFKTVPVDSSIVTKEARYIMSKMTTIRKQLSHDTTALGASYIDHNLENKLREDLTQVLIEFNKHPVGRGRVRVLKPQGTLLRFSTAGIYMPFAFEGQIDAGLHPLQYPFVLAHEMGHVYGYAEEGTCNFLGYLACMESEDLFVQYSGLLGYWRYLISNLRRTAPYSYTLIRKEMTPALRNDLNAIYDQMDKFPDILPKVRDKVYHTYLRSNGIKDGMENYNVIVQLTQQWKASGKNPDLLNKIYHLDYEVAN